MKFKFPNVKINNNLKRTLVNKTPEILTMVGTVGMIAGTILAVKATPKALKLIEKKEDEKGEELTTMETVGVSWKCYIPAVSIITISTLCICSGNNIHVKRNAALATACSLSTKALTEYKDKVKEVVGEKKAKAVQDAVAADKIRNNPIVNNEVIVTGNDKYLCYDAITGRYFKSDIETIKRAINELNRDLVQEMYISLNEFYCTIGLPTVSVGDNIGWNIDDGLIDISFSSVIADNGMPCLVCDSDISPRWDYRELS